MTDAELQTIRERAEKATPGPWRWEDSHPDDDGKCLFLKTLNGRIILDHWTDHVTASDLGVEADDREFIAAAREAVPALLAEVDRLRRELGTVQDACERQRQAGIDASFYNE